MIDQVTLESLRGPITHLDVRSIRARGKCLKLSDQEVREIRHLANDPMFTRKRLALLYRVHTSTISDLISRRTRTDI